MTLNLLLIRHDSAPFGVNMEDMEDNVYSKILGNEMAAYDTMPEKEKQNFLSQKDKPPALTNDEEALKVSRDLMRSLGFSQAKEMGCDDEMAKKMGIITGMTGASLCPHCNKYVTKMSKCPVALNYHVSLI